MQCGTFTFLFLFCGYTLLCHGGHYEPGGERIDKYLFITAALNCVELSDRWNNITYLCPVTHEITDYL